MINDLDTPENVDDVKMGGVAEQMMEGFSEMFIAIGLAIVIVYIVLAVSFRSWLTPLLIMASLPLASIGAVAALLITGHALGMSAMMGILMLVGIVLTNAIVLLTFVEDRRKEGASTQDALIDAGRIRLRPILMTALTTMIALVPLSLGLGEGELIAAELGVVVIGGLFSSTLLTLLVIPVLYSLTDRIRRKPPIKADSVAQSP
jgi:HAE1 family hydrophobic/amphiphilic exporter-1